MDKVKKYKTIVTKVLNKKLRFPTSYYPNLTDILVMDKEKNHFFVQTFGWDKKKYVNNPTYHLEVTEKGKVLIHLNTTDIQIEDILLENKIAEGDILDGMAETFPKSKIDSKAA